MRDAFVDELLAAAIADPSLVLITGDLGFGVLVKFAELLPDQFVNAGVAEQNMTALACGMALSGRKVFTYSIANFCTLRCLEQIRNDVSYHGADVTVVSIGGGFSYGQLGMSHFATEDLAILRAIPGMRVIAPSGEWETREATKALIAEGGPSYLRLDKSLAPTGPHTGERFELGRSRIVRQGSDVTLIGIGGIMADVLIAADTLAGEGIDARVISVHSVKPFDVEPVLAAAVETGGIVTVEEHSRLGGLGGVVAEVCLESNVRPRAFRRVGMDDQFPTIVGDQKFLRARYGLDAPAIVAAARGVLASAG